MELKGVDRPLEIKWTSEDISIAKIENGEVEAKSSGETRIVASIDGQQHSCIVTVEPKEDFVIKIASYKNSGTGQISISNKSYRVPIKKLKQQVDKELIEFKSSKTDVATINKNGDVTPLKVGKTTITVLYDGKEQDTFKLTITK